MISKVLQRSLAKKDAQMLKQILLGFVDEIIKRQNDDSILGMQESF